MQRGWASDLSLDWMIRYPMPDDLRRGFAPVRKVVWAPKPVWLGDTHPWDHAKDFAIISKMMKRET